MQVSCRSTRPLRPARNRGRFVEARSISSAQSARSKLVTASCSQLRDLLLPKLVTGAIDVSTSISTRCCEEPAA